ncbi:MAG: metallophosphoesterase [Spirochaetota bacterium]|nr:metallophosphoesterase [Spirochaetota bacterium]
MKILFVTDLHGCAWKYHRLVTVAQAFQADVVVNSGDMLPKDKDLFHQDIFITHDLREHFNQFEEAGIHYLCYLGNDDLRIFDTMFDEICQEYEYIQNLAQRKIVIDTIEFIGMNWVVDYPFRLKDRCRMDTQDYIFQPQFGTGLISTPTGLQEVDDWYHYAGTLPTIADELDLLVRPEEFARSIYVLHMPPAGLGLDVCSNGQSVGSQAIYEFLYLHQPMMSLHGHIHESPQISGRWKTALGNTLCIQPGQLAPFTYVTIDLATMETERHVSKSTSASYKEYR